jgi:signal transduction histidine kinase
MDTHRFTGDSTSDFPNHVPAVRNILERISSSFLGRYGLSLGIFAVLLTISAVLSSFGLAINLTILILVGLGITSWYGGLGPGILMAVLIVAATASRQPRPEGVSLAMHAFAHFSNFALIVFIVVLTHSRKMAELRLRKKGLELQRLNATLERRVAVRTSELELANRELEGFSYSVSHDLRSPLRAIEGFSQMLLEDHAHNLDQEGKSYLNNVRGATLEMSQLIDDMLQLASITKGKLKRSEVSLSNIAKEILAELQRREPNRKVEWIVEEGVTASADERLVRIAMQNLIHNAWKFTSKTSMAKIEFGQVRDVEPAEYFIRDNGAGFDMEFADKLFGAFERLHSQDEFEGTGVGLATVQRVVDKHGGLIRGESGPGRGAAFYFTL